MQREHDPPGGALRCASAPAIAGPCAPHASPAGRLDAALILPYDREWRFLLQHRTADAWIMPDHWAFFGGAIDAGETPEQAVHREALEELGLTLQAPRFVTKVAFRHRRLHGLIHVFAEPYLDDKSRLQLLEGQGWGWFTVAATAPLRMIARDRKIAATAAAAVRGWGAPRPKSAP